MERILKVMEWNHLKSRKLKDCYLSEVPQQTSGRTSSTDLKFANKNLKALVSDSELGTNDTEHRASFIVFIYIQI